MLNECETREEMEHVMKLKNEFIQKCKLKEQNEQEEQKVPSSEDQTSNGDFQAEIENLDVDVQIGVTKDQLKVRRARDVHIDLKALFGKD